VLEEEDVLDELVLLSIVLDEDELLVLLISVLDEDELDFELEEELLELLVLLISVLDEELDDILDFELEEELLELLVLLISELDEELYELDISLTLLSDIVLNELDELSNIICCSSSLNFLIYTVGIEKSTIAILELYPTPISFLPSISVKDNLTYKISVVDGSTAASFCGFHVIRFHPGKILFPMSPITFLGVKKLMLSKEYSMSTTAQSIEDVP
jgi:hypothetical protein